MLQKFTFRLQLPCMFIYIYDLKLCFDGGIIMFDIKNFFKSYTLENHSLNFFKFVNFLILCTHILILIFSFSTKCYILGYFNIASIALYIMSFLLISSGYQRSFIYLVEVEVVAHSFVCSILFSDDAGFNLYLFILIPTIFVVLFITKEPHYLLKSTLFAFANLILFIALSLSSKTNTGLYDATLSARQFRLIFIFNTVLCFTFMVVLLIILMTAMSNYISIASKTNVELDTEANHDLLTGLYNRRPLENEMENKIRLASNGDIRFSILMCDIDHFKNVNDTYGHDDGDIVLKDVADILKSNTRPGDFLCRWGGEEFVVILQNADITRATLVAQRIRANVENYDFILNDNNTIHLTITIGVTEYSEGKTAQDMYREADERMYKGKIAGRNRIVASD